jgi:hypothetical protein
MFKTFMMLFGRNPEKLKACITCVMQCLDCYVA